MNVVGHGAATTGPVTATALSHLATQTPTAIAFVLEGDEDVIYVGHSPMVIPASLTNAAPMDGQVAVILGRDPLHMITMVLPLTAFAKIPTAVNCTDIATIVGPAGHAAAPAVTRSGPHAAAANVNGLRARYVHLLPPGVAADAIMYHEDGRFTLPSFYAQFVDGKHDDPNALVAAMWAPTAAWFRLASTNNAGGESVVRTDVADPRLPLHRARLAGVVNRRVTDLMAQIGVGGPGLTNHAFATGIDAIKKTLEDNNQEHMVYDRASRQKTFADKHGAALEQRLCRFTGVTTEAALPETHRLLVGAARGREYSILNSQFAEHAVASDLPITAANAPQATPGLLEQVFRSYAPMNNGLTLGHGLSPFAIICDGHDDVEAIKRLTKQEG